MKSAAVVETTAAAWWHEPPAAARRYVRRAAARLFTHDVNARAVVTALLIGDRAGLDPDAEEQLLEAGTYHVLAISGGNVAVWTLVVVALASGVLRSARGAAAVGVLAVVAYGVVVWGEPSVARAVSAAALWLGARVCHIDARPLHVLSSVTVLLLTADPLMVVSVGAWLSFGATLAILTLAEPCAHWLFGGAKRSFFRHPSTQLLAGVLASSVAVQIALLPVGAVVFSRVAWASPIFNLVAVPAVAVAQMASMAAMVVWPLSASVAAIAASVAGSACRALLESPQILSAVLPDLAWRVPPPDLLWGALFYVSALGAVLGWPRLAWRRTLAATALATVVLLPVWPSINVVRRPAGWLRVSVLDVGQGDATAIEFPSGRSLLIDAGNRTRGFDSGERLVAPALWALGLRRLDWVLLTHADADHSGGLPAVVGAFAPREVWEGLPVPGDSGREAVRSAARRRNVSWRELRRGDGLEVDGVRLDVLHPPVPDWERRRVRNDDSVVLRLRWGALDVLMPGDAGADVERALVQHETTFTERGRFRVLKVGHHGSRTSTSPELVAAFQPALAVVSAGRNNAFGHPAPVVVDRLEAAGATVVRTDVDGALLVETDGQIVRARAWNGRVTMLAVEAPPEP